VLTNLENRFYVLLKVEDLEHLKTKNALFQAFKAINQPSAYKRFMDIDTNRLILVRLYNEEQLQDHEEEKEP
jgi:hypothetical protein